MKSKLLLLTLGLASSLLSCTNKSAIDQNITDYIKKNAHNPESYEPISTMPIDTVTELESVTSEIKYKLSSLESDSSNIERNKRMVQTDSSNVVLHNEILTRHLKESETLYKELDSMELASAIKDVDYWHKELLSSEEHFRKDKDELNKLELHLDSLQKQLKPNSIYRYHFIHQFRARVPIGGMMLKKAFIETDKDFNIIAFDEQ